jgi:hypothetical protein
MTTPAKTRKTRPRAANLGRRLSGLTVGLTVAKVLKADHRQLVIEFADGTRLFVKGDQQLEISVT